MHAEQVELATGARVFVATKGDGDELVLFLHPVGGDHTSWYHQMEGLADRYTVAAYDLRGHGRSAFDVEDSIIRDAVSIGGFAKDTIALIEQLGFRRAHLVGLALGGVIALEVFKRRSDVVQSMTLAASWAWHPDADARITQLTDRLFTSSVSEHAQDATPALFAPDTARELVQRAVQIEASKNKHVYVSSWTASFSNDYRPMLAMIDVPVLLVAGSHDHVAPADPLMTSIQTVVPMAQLVTIDGAGHYAQLDHPAEFTRALRSHLVRARPTEPQRIALRKRAKKTLGATTLRHAIEAILAERGVPLIESNDTEIAATIAHGHWLVSGTVAAIEAEHAYHRKAILVLQPKSDAFLPDLSARVDHAIAAITTARMATEIAISDATVSDVELYDVPRFHPHSASEASADAVERAARAIAKAQRPIIITSELGMHRGGPDALVQLATRHAIPVIEQKRTAFNFPTRHPLHLGFSSPAFIKQADVILVVESIRPWPYEYANLSHDPTVIQLAQAPLFRSPVPADLALAGHPALTLRRLTSCLDKQKPDRDRITGRFNAYASEHRRGLQQAQTRAIADATRNSITLQFLSYCLGEAIDDEVVIWNELELDEQLVPRRLPDSWFTLSPSPAAAVGGAIANSALTHVAITSNAPHPEAQRIATERKLPVVSIVYGTKTEGLRVDDPRVLVATLRQAFDVARKRRQPVVLNVVPERG